jgi:transposase
MADQNSKSIEFERLIGLDAHPDTFTAAVVRGPTPLAAVVEKLFNRINLGQLESWAQKHTTERDLIVLEASGNSFQIARSLMAINRQVLVLESCHLGKLKEAHANNDKISAVRIAKAYLSGTAKVVWIPDMRTQERRDLFHAHRKAVKQTTRFRNSLLSYLSDNGVRLKQGVHLAQDSKTQQMLRALRPWSEKQWQVLLGLLMQLQHAEQQRAHWRSLIAREVLEDQQLLSLVRLCGVRDLIAFALGALIGDIQRFAHPKKLVKYVGLNPAFDDSGEGAWSGGIGGHGRKDLRCLMIQAAQAILRCSKTPVAKWGKKLLVRKGSVNLAVAAIARKLTVAVWHLMMGRWTQLEEIDQPLKLKVTKIVSQVGKKRVLDKSGKTQKTWRKEAFERLKHGRSYVLDPTRTFSPKPAVATS